MTLQHKGGVTKSFTATCIAEHYLIAGRPLKVVDADPSNKSLCAYKRLHGIPLDIMDDGNRVDPRKFDDLIEDIASADSDFVVDNGATNFLPFMAYLVEHRVAAVLADHKRALVVHVPIVGGAAMVDTVLGFRDIAANIGDPAAIVVWLNEAAAGVIRPDGDEFEDTKVFNQHREQVRGIIRVPHHSSELFGRDMAELLTLKQTFGEGIAGSHFRLMAKQRLTQLQREIFEQLDRVL